MSVQSLNNVEALLQEQTTGRGVSRAAGTHGPHWPCGHGPHGFLSPNSEKTWPGSPAGPLEGRRLGVLG